MDISTLKIFLEAARTGSFTRTGENLKIAQPNISTAIAGLEKEWQTILFHRGKKGVQLTKRGEDFLPLAEKIVNLSDQAEQMMRNDSSPRGTLVIGAMESVAITRLPLFLGEYSKKWPDVRLILKTADSGPLMEMLRKLEVDVIFGGTQIENDQWQEKMLFQEEMVIATPALSSIRTFRDLTGSKFLSLAEGCSYRNRLMKFFHDKNLSPGAINEMGSLGSILACTVAGMGSALFTRSYLERFPEATEHLHLMQLPASERYMKIRMVWKKTRYLIPALKEFVSIFKV